jgi:hypothetical protein
VGEDKLLQITAPISPGSSGGPVLNGGAAVVGVSVATIRSGQNLNFAIPASYISTLLEKKGAPKPLAEAVSGKTNSSMISDLDGQESAGLSAGQFIWDYDHLQLGAYTFSVRNQLRQSVEGVTCLVIFYDSQGNPIEVDKKFYGGTIPAGLAKRIKGRVDRGVQRLTTTKGSKVPKTRVEFRILDFQIVR